MVLERFRKDAERIWKRLKTLQPGEMQLDLRVTEHLASARNTKGELSKQIGNPIFSALCTFETSFGFVFSSSLSDSTNSLEKSLVEEINQADELRSNEGVYCLPNQALVKKNTSPINFPYKNTPELLDQMNEILSSHKTEGLQYNLQTTHEARILQNSKGLYNEETQASSKVFLLDAPRGQQKVFYTNSALGIEEELEKDSDFDPNLGFVKEVDLPGYLLVLHPRVVSLLCEKLVLNACVNSNLASTELPFLPESFDLWDTNDTDRDYGTYFLDDEGTPTTKKRLIHQRKVQNHFIDLSLASRKKLLNPTGNGFRRSIFEEHPGECFPRPSYNSLRLKAGESSLKELIRDEPLVVVMHKFTIPFSLRETRSIESISPSHFDGTLYQKGKPLAFLDNQPMPSLDFFNQSDSNLFSLIHPDIVLTKDLRSCANGIFPFIISGLVES